jgi:hypothetical protein
LTTIGQGQHTVSIQFDKGTVFELGPGMGHRAAGQRLKDLPLGQLIEKLVPMPLSGFDGFFGGGKA